MTVRNSNVLMKTAKKILASTTYYECYSLWKIVKFASSSSSYDTNTITFYDKETFTLTSEFIPSRVSWDATVEFSIFEDT